MEATYIRAVQVPMVDGGVDSQNRSNLSHKHERSDEKTSSKEGGQNDSREKKPYRWLTIDDDDLVRHRAHAHGQRYSREGRVWCPRHVQTHGPERGQLHRSIFTTVGSPTAVTNC